MGTKVAVHHESRYLYERPVSLGPQTIQLRPAPHCRTPILNYSLEVTPSDSLLSWQFDPLANHVARVIMPGKTAEFSVTVDLVADMVPVNPFAFLLEPGVETIPFTYKPEVARDLGPFFIAEPAGPLMQDFLKSLPGPQATVPFLIGLNERVRNHVAYTMRLEHGVQTCEQTLEMGRGSCRDSSWLMVQVCRQLGLAARFVSGYLIQLADKEGSEGTEKRNTDSADLHAWAEVYLPGAGWLGLDSTSGLLTAEGHIPLACSTSPRDAAPISGTVEPAAVEFTYEVTVRRLDEVPGLANPFTEEAWQEVRELAYLIDLDLKAEDVRLTMGGEPTFVGIDGAESAQWNVEALGPEKKTAGIALIRSLRDRTAPGALLHLGQGKWYPGEPLPRWAFHCISRKDGVPVWVDGDLFAAQQKNHECSAEQAAAFLLALSRRLGARPEDILPAMEPAVDTSIEQEGPAGYILPLRRRQPGGRLAWSSQLWFPRPVRFTLSTGDSPIGYRIPLDMMPWVAPDALSYEVDENGQVELPPAPARRPEMFSQDALPDTLPPIPEEAASALELIRPALCVQAREGLLHVFLPYVPVLADYLDLVAAVEETAQYLRTPIWVEGYPAPSDFRMRVFSLTPDPGVLEANLPATSDWDELESLNEILAEQAEQHGLTASKFGYDGSHLATGGGSHVTLGGPSLADSPILRRPDVLRSMVSFWQNHPSLSYLFAGMYVGPTSQYPRVDEARVDALYELELAFSHLPAHDCPPYIVDGLFRNLLVDVTGNAHRAEFCIDKLYAPQGQGLQLGLLELRAFEMPPHHRMGLLQLLLVRALVSLFWKKPFTGSLLRWGTTLHDRFMLPHFVERDFVDVLNILRDAGYPFIDKWFASHLEFRFPKIGEIGVDGIRLELRQALEPWNVLAEETHSGSTGRSVDSSLERMQVKVTGLSMASRYTVACNGRRVPLHPTGLYDEAIAGIRYRARMLNASLHPTIPIHTPLTFDLIDSWKERSVARCIYYAGEPEGKPHTTRPANAAEARERRLRRFVVATHPQTVVAIPQLEGNSIFPMTLDLRWPSPREDINAVEPSAAPTGKP